MLALDLAGCLPGDMLIGVSGRYDCIGAKLLVLFACGPLDDEGEDAVNSLFL